VLAAGEITQDASSLNYWTSDSKVITVENTGSLDTSATIASSWTVSATDGVECIEAPADTVTCTLSPAEIGTYTVTSDAAVGEYATEAFTLTTNNTDTSETVTFVRMKDEEILSTLIEYGRGSGNYFYDSSAANTKGIQCTDLPALTDIQLHYLHKIYPTINTYLNIPSADGTNVELYCEYANRTILKTHLATNIVFVGARSQVNYSSDWIKDSWEKVFWTTQDFDADEQAVGTQIEVNCSSMKYYLEDANGWVTVSADSLALDFRDATPLTVSASSSPASIGTGTSEVLITYTITNTESTALSSSTDTMVINIEAPPEAQFIGTRGELWGYGEDVHVEEVINLGAGESYNITLAARFDTTGATPLVLSDGITISFVPCWQVNAYNPLDTQQVLAVTETITVTGAAVEINGVPQTLQNIENNLTLIISYVENLETISIQINNTVNALENTIVEINGTVNNIDVNVDYLLTNMSGLYDLLNAMNVTLSQNNEILLQVNATTTLIYNNTQEIYNYLTGTIFDYLNAINLSTTNTEVIVNQINTSNNAIVITVDDTNTVVHQLNLTVNDMSTTINNINDTTNYIWDWAQNVNITINNIWNTVQQINGTVVNITDYSSEFADIDTLFAGVTTDIRQLEEFEEESIYLITDSITQSQEAYLDAKDAASRGDTETAVKSLKESIEYLTAAGVDVEEIKAIQEKQLTPEEELNWFMKFWTWLWS